MAILRSRRWLTGARTLLVPLDHGLTMGPIEGIAQLRETLPHLLECGSIDGLILHKGTLRSMAPLFADHPQVAALLHISASVEAGIDAQRKVAVSSVEDALRLGADGVSVHVNLGHPDESAMLAHLGEAATACQRWGMPLLAMIYYRGSTPPGDATKTAALCVRVAWECGADAVKTDYPGDAAGFQEITKSVEIPVLVAGGSLSPDAPALFQSLHEALQSGAGGLAIGRNVFQRENPRAFARALSLLVHDRASVHDALATLEA